MSLLVIRPDEWNLPLLLHVGGAMVMCGALVVAAATLLLAVRSSPGGMAQEAPRQK